MSNGRKGARGAAAGFVLAAAGMLYSRLGGRRAAETAGEPDEVQGAVPSAEVERARAELAEELARRASRSDG